MTDLKDLLEHAAGAEPAVTDHDLAADLCRGRRALRRRRGAGVAAAAAATALVVGAGWAVLPGSHLLSEPGVSGATTTAVPTATSSPGGSDAERVEAGRSVGRETPNHGEPNWPPMPWAEQPVQLVRDASAVRGAKVHCAWAPEGWKEKLETAAPEVQYVAGSAVMYKDPTSTYPGIPVPPQYRNVVPSDALKVAIGPFGDKVGNGWDAQANATAGGKEAAVFTDKGNVTTGRPGEIFVRIDARRTVQVWVSPRTGWDVATALRFAGSCGPVR
jgi:hypothetical protein